MKRTHSDYVLDFEPEDADTPEKTAKMSNRSQQPFGEDQIPGLGHQYQNPPVSASENPSARYNARPYPRSEHHPHDRLHQPAPLSLTNRGDDVFTQSPGIGSARFPGERVASHTGGSSAAPWSRTFGQSTTGGYQPQDSHQSPASGYQSFEHHRDVSLGLTSSTPSPPDVTGNPHAESWSTQALISHNAGDVHSAMPRDLEMAMIIGRLEAELAREKERAAHHQAEAKRYRRERDEVRKALLDLQAGTEPSTPAITMSRGGVTPNLNQIAATPHAQQPTMNISWRSTGSSAWRSASSGISPTASGEMAVALRQSMMPMRGSSNTAARFGMMTERALLNDIFQKVENWGAANATLPIGTEAEGEQARALIAGAVKLCGASAFEEILNGTGTRKHLVAAFINRVLVNEAFTIRSARKANHPNFPEMMALYDRLQHTQEHDVGERAQLVQKVAETYASIVCARGYQHARDKMVAEITAEVMKELEPLISTARRSIAFDDMLALAAFVLRAAERFFSAASEWVIAFEETGNKFDIHTMVSRDERFNGDPRLHQDGYFKVTLAISPSVTRRDLSRGVVIPETLHKAQVLVAEAHTFPQRALSAGTAS